jgi:hypothetical protein
MCIIPAIIGTKTGTKKYFIWEQFCIVAVWKIMKLRHGLGYGYTGYFWLAAFCSRFGLFS